MATYIGNSSNLPEHKVEMMMAGASEINYQTVMRSVGDAVRIVFKEYPWGKKVGKNNWRKTDRSKHVLTMRLDWNIQYYKGMYDGEPVYIVRRSSTEYIFSKKE